MAPGTVVAQDARLRDAIAAAARTDPAETQGTSRAIESGRGVSGGAKAAERRRIAKHFSKLFQISVIFLQAFPNKALAVLWDFNGLQGFQTERVPFPNFSAPSASFRPRY
jgi:hypothetical protein